MSRNPAQEPFAPPKRRGFRPGRAVTGLAAAFGLTVASVVVAAGPAHAAEQVCSPNSVGVTFNTHGTSREITHVSYYSFSKGSSGTVSRTVEYSKTLSATVTFSTSATVEAGKVIGKLSATVGFSLAATGSTTSRSSQTVSINVGEGKWAVWRGQRQATGSYTAKRCNSSGTGSTTVKGTAKSYGVRGEGATKCGTSHSSSSWEYKAIKLVC